MKKALVQKGIGLIEVVIAIAILTASFTSIAFVFRKYVQHGLGSTERIKAVYLAEEGIEAVKSIRNLSWDDIADLTEDSPYYLSFSTTTSEWSLSSSSTTIDRFFTRSVVFDDVYRDGGSDIASSGTLDDAARLVTVNVEWTGIGTTTKNAVELKTYITDLYDN